MYVDVKSLQVSAAGLLNLGVTYIYKEWVKNK
jgi:hypothetical protein